MNLESRTSVAEPESGSEYASTPRRERTRSQLLVAANVVFAEIGVTASSVEQITEQAGFSRGAFYSNFSSKEELFLELVLRASDEKLAAVEARLFDLKEQGLSKLTPEDVAEKLLDALVEDRFGVLLMSEVRTIAMRVPQIAAEYLRWSKRMVSCVSTIIDEVLNETRFTGRLPADEIARHLIMTWEATASSAAIAGLDANAARSLLRERVTAIARALVDG